MSHRTYTRPTLGGGRDAWPMRRPGCWEVTAIAARVHGRAVTRRLKLTLQADGGSMGNMRGYPCLS